MIINKKLTASDKQTKTVNISGSFNISDAIKLKINTITRQTSLYKNFLKTAFRSGRFFIRSQGIKLTIISMSMRKNMSLERSHTAICSSW